MGVPVALGRVVLGQVALAPAGRVRVLERRVGQQLVARLVAARVRPPPVRVVWAVQPRAALRLRRVPAAKTTAGLQWRARASRAASRPGPRDCHLKFHAPID